MSPLRRCLVLFALLPQLVVFGLGRGVVVCVEAGGESRLEVAVGGCCADVPVAHAIRDVVPVGGVPDCGSCTDYRIVPDPRQLKGWDCDWFGLPPSEAAPARPVPAPERNCVALRVGERGEHRLILMRSVMLRC